MFLQVEKMEVHRRLTQNGLKRLSQTPLKEIQAPGTERSTFMNLFRVNGKDDRVSW